MKLFVARDTTNELTGFVEEPIREEGGFFSPKPGTEYYMLDEEQFPEITWENSPQKVEVEDIDDETKHKVGDKIKIHSLDWYNENKDETDCVESFVPSMTRYCGKEAVITEIVYGTYLLDVDGGQWYWTDDMFEDN